MTTADLTEVSTNRSVAEALRDSRSDPAGLTDREAERRLSTYGPNVLARGHGRRWPAELLGQFTQPLAVLLILAAVLAWIGNTPTLAIAIVVVIVLNAVFAFVQENQAERAVETLAGFLPATAFVLRGNVRRQVAARDVVPGDLLLVAEGDKVCADAQLVSGEIVLDLSALTGESLPVERSAAVGTRTDRMLDAANLIFSGTTCSGGEATAVVTRTGMHTELGRIASLSERGKTEKSPLERQVFRATMIIGAVAIGIGAAFLPVGVAAGLSWAAALSFSIGLIVANVPEGLLPTITLALAAGVRQLAHRGAVVKRLSAVETLGSVTVICTDKTGTLTQNRMRVTTLSCGGDTSAGEAFADKAWARTLVGAAAACTTAEVPSAADPSGIGDPTELAILELASEIGQPVDPVERSAARAHVFRFDPHLKRMSTVDRTDVGTTIHTKGALETILPLCTHTVDGSNNPAALDDVYRDVITSAFESLAKQGLRVLAVAERSDSPGRVSKVREDAESGLGIIGLIAMADPVRDGVANAVSGAHAAGIRIHVVTGDSGTTASAIASQIGIGTSGSAPRIVNGVEFDALTDAEVATLFESRDEIVFARVSPEAKLRIAEALQGRGEIVAMTDDGVNDAPALRHADIGVAMGRSGTDVAREAATIVLTDDNFATIVTAVGAGRQVFDNVRKFVLYIFAHAVPEVVPFLVFAASGGAIPLPLTVLQILAIDLGTETFPALALGREPAEPGLMSRPPRSRRAAIIDRALLTRAWLLLGSVSAVLVMGGFLATLIEAGWSPGDPTGPGTPLHHAYLQATTMSFIGIVACQIGTAFAARTERASLFTVGIWTNRPLLWGILFELVFTAAVVYAPPLQRVFGTAAVGPVHLLLVAPFPLIVWGVDELVRRLRRTRHRGAQS